MEEVPAHHEHRSGLIWSGDRETCYTDLQCRRFGRNLFQCYSVAPHRRRSNTTRSWIYFLTYWLTHASQLLWEFGSRCYLSLLEDFDAIMTYSWGSSLGGARQIGGTLVLVQIWG
ncbi:hypothetical protein M9H77_11275 [Catharanthus roseus]|uniref:Uncharacterized protein n=1 Tax=Catharanthus roseus TaxID=4058 RepID=A0ACC0BE53_CATRO|nr:hypothetical protein M9H77_11275 [Catharanthus roseus]